MFLINLKGVLEMRHRQIENKEDSNNTELLLFFSDEYPIFLTGSGTKGNPDFFVYIKASQQSYE